ncbi:Aminotransferase, class V [Minicystis rosea]|nr:Aminotransferase, class V [Minicystis rosea]
MKYFFRASRSTRPRSAAHHGNAPSERPDAKMRARYVMDATTVKRRQFLTSVLATTTVMGCHGQVTAPVPDHAPPAGDAWQDVRSAFNLSPDWIHLGGFLLASHPKPVREAIERHRRALEDNPVLYLEDHDHVTPVRVAAAAYMGVQPDEIALTDSTTMGLATLYNGLPLRAGDDVVTTAHDHYATHESLRLAAERTGAVVRRVPLYDRAAAATAPAMTEAIARAIRPETRVVAITWVHSSTGVRTPVRAIAEVVARANAGRDPKSHVLLCVDGVHGFGVENVTMSELGCDFFVAGCHKWIFGPHGTGLIWGKAEKWRLLRPTIPQFGPEAYGAWMKGTPPPPTTADMMTPGGFHAFEHRWALGEAFDFHRTIGKARVAARIHELNRQCKEGLAAMKHVVLHTPRADDISAGIITFEVLGMEPRAVVKRLAAARVIATTTPYATSYARLAPGLINTPEDVEAALRAVRALG